MAKIPNTRRLSSEDYEGEYQSLIEALAHNLNPFMENVTDAINGNLDFQNLAANSTQVIFSVDANGKPIGTDQFNTGVANPSGFQVISAVNQTNQAVYPTGQPFISFIPQGNGLVKVNKISNLPANNRFLLTVIVY